MLLLARQFMMPLVFQMCEDFLLSQKEDTDNILRNFELSEEFNLEMLRELTMERIYKMEQFRPVVANSNFEKL
ncbi:hypothetical protein PENTCL1PPCAC_25964, partial [Pristionchus entomophagus]